MSPPRGVPARLPVTEEDKVAALETMKELGVGVGKGGEGPVVGMAPGAVYGTAKRWPAERFAWLADLLTKECRAQVVLFGAPSEKDVAEEIEEQVQCKVHNLVGRTQLRLLAALLGRCRVVVSNDTGAMHVAAAAGTRLVVLFGSTNPVTTSPVGDEHVLIRHPVDCSPCLLRHCPIDHRCMTAIEVEEVFEAVRKLL